MKHSNKFSKLDIEVNEQLRKTILDSLDEVWKEENITFSLKTQANESVGAAFIQRLRKLQARWIRSGKPLDNFSEIIDYYETVNGTSIYQSRCSIESLIIQILPKKLIEKERPNLIWQVLNNGEVTPPHIDPFRNTVINLYVQAYGEKTYFYNKKREGISFPTLKNETLLEHNSNSVKKSIEYFVPSWLNEDGNFVARPFDVYLLNVSEPHSVIDIPPDKSRVSISAGFLLKYEEVLSYFEES